MPFNIEEDFMKYCSKCGTQLIDEAYVCTHCGCLVEHEALLTSKKTKNAKENDAKKCSSWVPFVLGIMSLIGMIFLIVLTFVDFNDYSMGQINQSYFYLNRLVTYFGLLPCAPLALIFGIKYLLKSERTLDKTFSIIGLCFGSLSTLMNFIFCFLSF